MSTQNNDLLNEFEWRGLLAQVSSPTELKTHLAAAPRAIYCGFDPTADSLHIGSLVPLLALRRLQLLGHRPILVLGGATGLIGDPSFKAAERSLNTEDVVAGWVERLQQQVERFLDFGSGDQAALIVNNLDWIQPLDTLTFLRDIGKHFSINAMIQKESVKQRIEREGEGISYTEFTYMILQAYDFVELNKRYNCSVQIGGNDQWGNITGGIDLTRRMNQQQVFGITLPLVTKADGSKFGKTESGTVWLDAARTSPYAFYQFWINTSDADVYNYLRYFTFLDQQAIADIEQTDATSGGRPTASTVLAKEVTELVHGSAGVEAAQRISDVLFSGEISRLTEQDCVQLALDGLPCTNVSGGSRKLIDLLVDTGLALTPRGEVTLGQARKFVSGNAVTVNGVKINNVDTVLHTEDGLFNKFHLIKRGKKEFHLLRWA